MATEVTLKEIEAQPYRGTRFSAGLAEGHPVDTVYLKLERWPEEPTVILLRRDEALALIRLLAGALWSDAMDQLPGGESDD